MKREYKGVNQESSERALAPEDDLKYCDFSENKTHL